jgi:Ca2+-binding RTX toxin-like protein/Tol biopolymer transport system component
LAILESVIFSSLAGMRAVEVYCFELIYFRSSASMWGVKHSRSSSVRRQLRRKRDPRRSDWRRRFALELLENRHLLAGLIYFSLDSQIRSVPAGGGEEQVLFAGDEPRISPDGRWLAYRRDTADESHQRGLWLYDLETEKRFNAQTTSSSITAFSFTPDSQQLVTSDSWNGSLYTLTVDRLFQSPVFQSNVRAPNVNPVDGSIAVQYFSSLSILEEGSLTRTDIVTTGTNLRPVWSADGQWISFVRRMTSGAPLELYKVRRDGSELQKLSSATGDFAVSLLERGATWSPDGQLLYVGGSVGGIPGIYAIPTDGSLADGSIQPELIHETPTVPNHVSAYFDPSLVSVGTTLSLDASPETSQFGESVTFTAMVTADSGTQLPTGQVDFYVNQFHTASATVVDGVAEWTTQLMAGLHEVRARFLPDNSSFSFSSAVTGHNVRSAALTADSRMAYELNGDLHITSLDGSSDTVIRSGSAPRISPNGRYVAFLINNNLIARDLQTDVQWIVGSSSRPVFAWSNDSRSLFWRSTSSSGPLYESPFDSRAILRSVSTSDDGPSVNPIDGRLVLTGNTGLAIRSPDLQTRVVIPGTQAGDSWPVWSPDGQWILFSRWGSSLNAFSGFYKIRPDGSDLTQLTDDAVKPANRDSATAVWTLDGNHILYGGRLGNQTGVYRFVAEPAEPGGPFQAELFLETVGGIPRHVSTPRPPQAPLVDTHLTLTSSANPVAYGETVTYTATLSTASGIPSGVITFRIGENSRFDVPLDSNGQAVLTIPVPLPGSDNLVRAEFQPSSEFAYSTTFLNQRVLLSDSLAAGPKVAFSVGTRVYVANADGSGVMFLTNGFQPKMSPDGRYVAFRNTIDSSSYHQQPLQVRDLQTNSQWQANPWGNSVFDFNWTVNNQIVFDSLGWGSIIRINADGSGLTTLRPSLQGRSIAVNPIDQRIALHSSSASYPGIWLFNQDGTGLVQFPGTQAGDKWPSWSPDGEWLTFIRGTGTEQAVYKIRTDGSDLTRLSDPGVLQLSSSIPVSASLPNGSQAVWAADDHLLVSGILDGVAGIYRLAGDGSEMVNLEIGSGSLVNTVGSVRAEWQQVTGATITWTNASGGNWSTASNWSSGRVPGPGDHVVIPDLGAAGANLTITFAGPTANVASVTTAENLELTGGNLVISGQLSGPGLILLRGGQLTGATIASGTTVRATSSTSTIDGLTVNGNIEATSANLNLRNGAMFTTDGKFFIDNGYSLGFEGSQRISGTGQINLGFGSLNSSASTTTELVVDDGMLLNLRNGWLSGSNLTVVNYGVIEADSGTSSTEMRLQPARLVNYGTLRASGGGRLLVDAVQWENHGQIISAAGSSLGFGGQFATPSIAGRVSQGGLFYLSGVMQNRNHQLNLTATTGPLYIRNGTIVGGVINTEGANELVVDTGFSGVLDNLTLNGTGRVTVSSGSFIIRNDLELNGSILLVAGSISFHSNHSHQNQRVRTSSTGQLTNGSVSQGGGMNHTVTFEEGIVLTGMSSFSGLSSGQAATWVNYGTMRTGGRSVSFSSSSHFINEVSGVWQVDGTASTRFSLDGLWENRGAIKLTSGEFELDGTFAQSDVLNVVREGGTLAFNGRLLGDLTLDETTGPWKLNGGEFVNSVISSSFPLVKNSSSQFGLNGVTISEGTQVSLAGRWCGAFGCFEDYIVNGITINGELIVGGAFVDLNGTQSIRGTGAIVGTISSGANIYLENNKTVIFEETLTIRGGNLRFAGSGTSVFYGLLQPDVAGGNFSWGGNFENYGEIQPISGTTITFDGASFTNYKPINVSIGRTVRIQPTTFTNAVEGIITASGGTLQLGRSGSSSGPTRNFGRIEIANATVELGGTFEQADFGAADPAPGQGTFIRSADQPGTVTLVGNMIGDLTLDSVTGSWFYGGSGTLKDSTIRTSDGVTFSSPPAGSAFYFDNVVIPTSERIDHDRGTLYLRNGLLLDGTLNVGSDTSTATLWFDGTQTIGGSGEIVSRRPQSGSSNNSGGFNGTNPVITFGPNLTVRGGGWTVSSGSPVGTINLQGLLQPDVTGQTITFNNDFLNYGHIEPVNGSTITFAGSLFTNYSTIEVSEGNTVRIQPTTFTNAAEGTIHASGGTLQLGRSGVSGTLGPTRNFGRIEIANTVVELGGTFVQSDFGVPNPDPGQGTFIRSADQPGTVRLVGTLNGDLTLDEVTGMWEVGSGGGLINSTVIIQGLPTSEIISSGWVRLENVTIPSDIIWTQNDGNLRVRNGLTVDGVLRTSETGSYQINPEDSLTIDGSGELLATGTLFFGVRQNNTTVVLGPELTVRGRNVYFYSENSGWNTTYVLQGLLQAEVAGAQFDFYHHSSWNRPRAFINQGIVSAINGGRIVIGTTEFTNHGFLSVGENSSISVQPNVFHNFVDVSSIRSQYFSATLTGGQYHVDQGTLRMWQGTSSSAKYLISTLDTELSLSGPNARVFGNENQNVDALSELNRISEQGSLTLSNGSQVLPRGELVVEGSIQVDEQSSFGRVVEMPLTTDGLVTYLAADGNAADSLGNNSGVLMSGTSFTEGILGQAFLLNGTNNYVSIADSPSLRNDSLTVEGWFRMDQFTGGTHAIFAKPIGSASNSSYAVLLVGNYLQVQVANASGSSSAVIWDEWFNSSNIGVWNHVSMTLEASGRVHFFLNGVQRLDWNSGRPIAYDNNPHLIGARLQNGNLSGFFPGAIDEVRYYDRVLSADEIQANYLQPLVTRINQVAGQVNINGVLRSQDAYTLTGGTLYGEGTLPTNLNHLGGTVAPGNSPGCMTIDGDYTQATSAVLQIELEGTEVCSQYDRLTVSGAVSLAGQIEVVLAPGYTPAVGSQFLILQNDGVDPIQGVFDDLLEREIVIVDGDHLFQITYVGGDGNDIVLTYLGQGVVVTNANPSGPGSLSQAILDTNAKPGEELVAFAIRNIHATGGVYLLDDDLPTITDAVVIDGTTQSDYFGSPRIERRGSGLGSGLVFGPGSEGSQLIGLSITGWQAGVQISTDNVQLAHNWIGLETDGLTTRGNAYGVLLDAGSSGSTIGGSAPEQRNVISGNTMAGVWIDGGQSNTVLGNWIGTDATGHTVIGNGPAGVLLSGGATGNVIGDASGTAVNVIVGDQSTGVLLRDVSTTGNTVAGNWIGLTVDGQSTFAGVQLARGVAVENAVGNFVGRDGSALVGNWIGGAARGISIEGDDSLSNIVRGNVVGLSPVGSHVIANQVGIVVDGTNSTVVGGVATGQANTISGNTVGIRILESSQSTLISGNRIGLGITDAATAPGNQQSGIELLGGLKTVVTDNRIVSSGTAGTFSGIQVGDVPAVLRRNLISASSGESISTLSSPGVIELTQARVDGFVLGRILSATPNTTFTVDFYSAPQPGEALQYIGSSAVLTDDLGMSEFEISGLGDIPPTWYLSATITGPRTEGSDDLSTSPHSNGVIPQAAIIRGLPERGSEGTPVNLKAFAISGSVAGFSVTGYRWDITKDGLAYASGGEAGIQFSPDDQGEYQVVLTLILTNDVGEQRLEILGPHTMQIQNVAPTPQFEVTPNSLKIGQPVILVSTSSDPGLLDVLSYAWVIRSGSLQGQIVFEQADSTDGQTATFVPDSGGIYYATLTVDDQDGGVRSLTRQFQVAGLPSSLSISAPTSGSEGQTVRARAPEDLLQRVEEVDFTWTVIKNPVAIGPSQQVPFLVPSEGVIEFTPDDDGLYRILLSASDETGLITADPIDVVVTNASPVVAIQGGNIEASISQPVTFTALVTDPGTADTHVVDWVVLRNGVPVAQAANGGLQFTFTPTAGGVYVVRATATDDDYDAVTGTGRGVGQTVLYVAESPIGISLDYSPGPYAEGDPVSFAPVVPAGVTVVSYEWLARDSRGYQVAAQSGTLQSGEEVPEFDFAPRQGGRYMITLNVILSDSRSSTVYSDILEVAGTAPVIDTLSVISPLGIVREGAEVIVRASASDDREPVGLSYAWEILKPGAAEWISMDSRTGRPSDLLFVPDNDGPYEVRVTVTDTQGLWAQLSLTVNVANVAPEVRLGITQQIGNIITFEALATDPSSEDAANLTYAWSTDGTNFTGFSSSPVFSVDVNQLGSVLVVAVSDDTETTTMQSFILKGSAGNDVVTITAANSSAAAASGADQIVYLALDGNDSITVDGSVSLPVTIFGGAGDDTLDASAAMVPVVLDGGSGNDVLRGGAGDDVLVAGPGTNWLYGGQGNNLFIGGGNDTMTGGSGDDTYRVHFSDVVINDIQGGYNTIDLSGVPQAVTLDFGQTDGTPQPVFSGSTLALNGSFDLLIGTAFSDTLHAGIDGTELRGGGGNDQLSASAQGVILDAGEGDNTLILQGASGLFRGGIGSDTFIGTLGTLDTSYLHLGDGDDVVAVAGPSGGLAPVFISAGSGENDIEVTRVTGTIYDGFGSDFGLTEFGTADRPTRSKIRAIISSDISIFGTAAGSEISVVGSQDISIFGGGGDSVELSEVSQALLDGSLFGAATPNQPFTATVTNSSDVSIFGSAQGGQPLTATLTASSEISIFGSAVSNSISVLSGSDVSIFGVAEGSIWLDALGEGQGVVGASIYISEFGNASGPGEPVSLVVNSAEDIGIFGSATPTGSNFTATVTQSSDVSIFGSAGGSDSILVLSSQDVAIYGIVSGDIQLGPELDGSGDAVSNVIVQMTEFGAATSDSTQLNLLVNNAQDVSIFGSAGSASADLNATIVNSSDIGIFGSASGGQISVASSQDISIFGQGSDTVTLEGVIGGNVFTQIFGGAQPSGALIVNVAENSGDISIFGSASRNAVITVSNSGDIQIFGGNAISPDGLLIGDTVLLEGVSGAVVAAGVFGAAPEPQDGILPTVLQLEVSANSSDLEIFGTASGKSRVTVTASQDIAIFSGYGDEIDLNDAERVRIEGGRFGTARPGQRGLVASVVGNSSDIAIFGTDTADQIELLGGQFLGVDMREGDDDLVIDGAMGVIAITDAGDDFVTVLSGEDMLLYLGAGNDRAKVVGGRLIRVIGGEGDDEFHVAGGELVDVDGGAGDDILAITEGSFVTARLDDGADQVTVFGGVSMYLGAGQGDDGLFLFGSLGSALPAGEVYAVLDGQAGNNTLAALPLLTSEARSELDSGSPLARDPLAGLPEWIDLPESITQPTTTRYPSSVALVGGSGDDTLWMAGNVRLVGLGGDGQDTLHLLTGSGSVVSGGRGDDQIYSHSEGVDNTIFGDEGDDTIEIFDGTRTSVFGQEGDDTIRFFGGEQSFARGGSGSDQMSVNGGRDLIISGEQGNDHLTVHNGTNILAAGGSGQDYLMVDGGYEVVLLGESGWDHLEFAGGEVVNLSGGDGNDLLEAFARGAFLYGDDGDDTYRIHPISGETDATELVLRELKFVDGGNYDPDARGSDTIDLSQFSAGVTFDVGQLDAVQDLIAGQLSLTLIGAFENIVGTSGDDILIGSDVSNRLDGGPGNDTLIGMGGDNVFIPGPGDNVMHGGLGNDEYLFATTAGQPLGVNTIYEAPGGGEDLLNFSGMPVGLDDFDMTSPEAQVFPDGMLTLFLRVSPTDDGVAEIENLIGTNFDDTVMGNDLDNRFELLSGNDVVDGRGGKNVYIFRGGDLGSIFIAGEPNVAGQATLDFTAFDSPLVLDLELTTPQEMGGDLSLTLASPTLVANVVGTSFDDVILGNSLDNAIYGGAGSDYLDGRSGNDSLVADLPSIVFLDFDSAFNAERGDYSYSVEERNEIQSRVEQAFAAFNWQFTQDELAARSWTDRMGGSFVRLAFNEGRGGGVAGDAGEVDFRNISRRVASQVNINALMGAIETIVLQQLGEEFTQQEFDAAKASLVVDLTATIAAHELGHTAGLRHSDAFGPIGSGVYEATDVSRFYPFYSGTFEAFETPLHTIASPASVGTSLLDAARSTFFGPREAIKLAFSETGRTVREQGSQFGSHATMQAAEDLGELHPLYVPNLAPTEGYSYSGMKFKVSALAVIGDLRADPEGDPSNPADTEYDYYRFAARAGEWLNVELMSTSIRPLRGEPFDGELRLYDEQGNLLAFNDDELETKDATLRDFLVPEDGTYYLRVGLSEQPAWPTHGGRYELFLTRFQALPEETEIPSSQGDTLIGGAGSNILTGGAADDLFLASAGGSNDQFFGRGGFDTLDLLGIDYTLGSLDSVENVINANVAPTATLVGVPAQVIYIGDSFTASLIDPIDPSMLDTLAGFRYAFELRNGLGSLVSGSPELPNSYQSASAESSFTFTVLEEGSLQLTARIFDQQNGYRDYTAVVQVSSVPVEGQIVGPSIVQHGDSATFGLSISNLSETAQSVLRYSFALEPSLLADSYETAGEDPTSSFTFSQAGRQTVYARIFNPNGESVTWQMEVSVETTWAASEPSAIQLDLPFDIDLSFLRLYAGPGSGIQPGIQLVGKNTGLVSGSVVWNEASQALVFVKSGGPLEPDDYTLTLFSREGGFRLTDGTLLDGNVDGNEGGDFVYHFRVEDNSARVVSLPDFARGSGQVVNLKFDNADPGIPISISDGRDVIEVEMDIVYDAERLEFWSTYVSDLPEDWTTTVAIVESGRFRLHLSGQTPLGSGPQTLTRLLAGVPSTAPYGSTNLLTIENLLVKTQDGNEVPSLGDLAIHQVMFIGDGNADGLYTAQDAAWIAGLVEAYHTGFDAYTWIDPLIVADVNQDGRLDSEDVQWLLRKALDPTLQPEIPDPLPGEFDSQGLSNTVVIADLEVPVRPGDIVQVPLRITESAAGLWAIDVVIDFDPNLLSLPAGGGVAAAELAGAFLAEEGWSLESYSVAGSGQLRLSFTRSSPSQVTEGTIALVSLMTSGEALSGPIALTVSGFDTVAPVNFQFQGGSVVVVAHAPSDLIFDQQEVIEDKRIQTEDLLFGELQAVDEDLVDRFGYELVEGQGDGDNFRFRIVDNQIFLAAGELLDYDVRPEYLIRVRATDLVGNAIESNFILIVTPSGQVSPAVVVGRHLFYNASYFDGNSTEANEFDDSAIATDKAALLPGQTATLINYSSYSRGINGIMIDVQGLKDPLGISVSDFEFRIGNSQSITSWVTATEPLSISVRQGAGVNGSDRITVIWEDNAIQKQWLQVKLLATDSTGLQQEDIHYWGNAIGETGDTSSHARVTATDEIRIRNNFSSNPKQTFGGFTKLDLIRNGGGPKFKFNPSHVDSLFDINRDGVVDELDALLARANMTTFINALRLISV